MDRTLSAVLAVLVVASVIFLVGISFSAYVGITYRATLSSTYEYRVTIATDEPITNVTLFLPVPESRSGPSAPLEGVGAGKLAGLPSGWNIALLGSQKMTMLEVTAGEMGPTPPGEPYLLSLTAHVPGPIHTEDPASGDPVLNPSAERRPFPCTGTVAGASPDMGCEMYESPVYADFTSPGNARLSIFTSLVGRNSWDVFGPSSNEYQDGIQASFTRYTQGWQQGSGMLITGIGDYGIDPWLTGGGTPDTGRGTTGLRITPFGRAGEGTG